MTAIDRTINTYTTSPSHDCDAFLNWDEEKLGSESEMGVVFQSLVANMRMKPSPDNSLEAKAVKLLEIVSTRTQSSADAFLRNLGRITDESLTNFVQSIGVLISSPNQVIITAAIEMVASLIIWYSPTVRLALLHADLIPQIVNTLNELSLPFTEVSGIHTYLMITINCSIRLATPFGLAQVEMKYYNKQQTVPATVLKQVVIPSEKYIWYLCMNRFSIIDGEQLKHFMELLTQLLEISTYHLRTMDFVLQMPVFLPIPGCLTFFETENSIWAFLDNMNHVQCFWIDTRGLVRQMWKTVSRMLRMEGIEDVIDEKLQNDENEYFGREIVDRSIIWNNLLARWSPQSPSPSTPLSHYSFVKGNASTDGDDSEGSEDVVAESMAVLDPSSVTTHTLPLPSASPSPPTPSHSPLPRPSPHSAWCVLVAVPSKQTPLRIRSSSSRLILSPFQICPQIVARRSSSPAPNDALVA
ncbi:hypothetical protein BLNAU_7496 [Blattamonas nauphoetae]|uniref:Uncharacterized protein n=1 Tax=Blattamonas nauphoetae TaxID=2049346 RepID=A0ABQ9Y1H3_9EUKA|nr:hypothetical protein BLNAU_7496 [Blattamonas nauphoetae]